MKIFPALLGGYLLFRNRASLVWLTYRWERVATLLPLLWVGPDALSGFVRHSQGNCVVLGDVARGYILGVWAFRPSVGGGTLGRFHLYPHAPRGRRR